MLDTSRRWRNFWLACTFALLVLLALVVDAFLGTLVFGVFLYYSSRPIYDRLRPQVRPPTLAALTALVIFVLPVVLLFGYIIALALGEIRAVASVDLSAYEEILAPYIDLTGSTNDLGSLFESLLADPGRVLDDGALRQRLMDVATTAGAFLGTVLNSLFHLFIALLMAFYLLRDDDRLVAWVRNNFEDETLEEFGGAVDADLQNVFFGNILNALLTAVIGTVVFSLLGTVAPSEVPVPVPILLGLLTGVTSLVPVIGMRIVTVPVALYLAALAATTDPQLLWFPALFFVVSLIFVETIPDLILRPYISGRNLHVGLVMFSYLFGPLMFGWYGLFLGPLLLVVLVHFGRIVIPELAQSVAGPSSSTARIRPGNRQSGARGAVARGRSSARRTDVDPQSNTTPSIDDDKRGDDTGPDDTE